MTPSTKLFGTDGVRGVAGTELTAELALALGRAAACSSNADRPQVLIVRDTRESGPMLESALAAGVAEGGGDALLGGVLPTPAASILVRRLGLDLGAVVSASHNPWQHNGIKFFGADGRKLDDELEARIEARVAESGAASPSVGRVRELDGALDDYLRELLAARSALDLSGRRVLLDCAQRRDLPGGAARLRAARRRRRDDRRRARRPQHQRGLRLHPPGGARGGDRPPRRRRSGSPSTATATG